MSSLTYYMEVEKYKAHATKNTPDSLIDLMYIYRLLLLRKVLIIVIDFFIISIASSGKDVLPRLEQKK